MEGRAFLGVARRLAAAGSEADWRTAAGRAYYALIQEAAAALKRWGLPAPPRNQFHHHVRQLFTFSRIPDLKAIGQVLEQNGNLRSEADYRLDRPGSFATAYRASWAVQEADKVIALLDAIEADPTRRSAASADVQKTLPPTP